jgi:multiple sugar transport system permease protein
MATTSVAGSASRAKSVFSRLRWTREEREAFLLIFPIMALFFVFLMIPTFQAFVLAFYDWAIGGVRENQFIGFGNYARMRLEWRFWNSLRVSATYAIGMATLPYLLALPLAIFMNMKIRGRAVFRTMFFLPVVTPIASAGIVFVYLFNTDFGLVNSVLLKTNLISTPISWLGRGPTAIAATMIMIVWMTVGFNAVTLLSGLQTIAQDIRESAVLDGATGWTMFRHVTFPLLRPASVVVITVNLITAFQMFGQIYVTTMGGPAKMTEVIGMYIYENAFHYWQLGFATSLGTIVFVICLVVNAIMGRIGETDWR